jgi:hypothetical protein
MHLKYKSEWVVAQNGSPTTKNEISSFLALYIISSQPLSTNSRSASITSLSKNVSNFYLSHIKIAVYFSRYTAADLFTAFNPFIVISYSSERPNPIKYKTILNIELFYL